MSITQESDCSKSQGLIQLHHEIVKSYFSDENPTLVVKEWISDFINYFDGVKTTNPDFPEGVTFSKKDLFKMFESAIDMILDEV